MRQGFEPIPAQDSGAITEGAYRYLLWRRWDASRPCALWILLNPSLADAQTDDHTLRRCKAFSASWQFGGLEVVNLFAFRTPYPRDLHRATDPVGEDNDHHIAAAIKRATCIIVAWGAHGAYRDRDQAALTLLRLHSTLTPYCLGVTRANSPRHPLYVAYSVQRIPVPSSGLSALA